MLNDIEHPSIAVEVPYLFRNDKEGLPGRKSDLSGQFKFSLLSLIHI